MQIKKNNEDYYLGSEEVDSVLFRCIRKDISHFYLNLSFRAQLELPNSN